MYLANPILLIGVFGLTLALVLLPWRFSTKTEAMQKSVGGILTMLTTLGVIWTILGAVVGLNHMAVHGDCLKQKEVLEAKKEAGELSAADQEAEKAYMATCNTIVTRYAKTN